MTTCTHAGNPKVVSSILTPDIDFLEILCYKNLVDVLSSRVWRLYLIARALCRLLSTCGHNSYFSFSISSTSTPGTIILGWLTRYQMFNDDPPFFAILYLLSPP